MRDKSGRQIDDLQIGKLMEQFGFNPAAPHSTARALILNLVRSAYGAEVAREFMRQMNLVKAQTPETTHGVEMGEMQLSLFDFPQKKSRQA